MPLYTKKDFADKCGIETKNLSKYIQRGKVIVQPDGMINDKVSENKLFLEKNKGKRTERQLVDDVVKRLPIVGRPDEEAPIEIHDDVEEDEHDQTRGIMSVAKATQVRLHFDARKKEQETRLLRLKEQKLKGEVIPYQVITPLFLQHNQSMVSEFKNGADELVRMMAKKTGMSNADQSEMKGVLIKIINLSMEKATALTMANVESLVNEFIQKKGVGERS